MRIRKRTRIVRDAAEAPRIAQSLGATPQKIIIAPPSDRVKLCQALKNEECPGSRCGAETHVAHLPMISRLKTVRHYPSPRLKRLCSTDAAGAILSHHGCAEGRSPFAESLRVSLGFFILIPQEWGRRLIRIDE